jgi:hypothetical protein
MYNTSLRRRLSAMALGVGLSLGASGMASAAGFEVLTATGGKVMKSCNPGNSNSSSECRVTSLPGESGYNLVASRSAPIVINDVVVGTQFEKVWRHCTDRSLYIFGARVQMNANVWDDTGAAFNVNDLLRQTRTDSPVAVAYNVGSPASTKQLQYAGRTATGLYEYDTAQPARDNAWVAFRIDANAAESSGASSPNSPWLLTKTRAPEGFEVQDFALRLLNSENEAVDQNSIYSAGYQPICTSDACAPAN